MASTAAHSLAGTSPGRAEDVETAFVIAAISSALLFVWPIGALAISAFLLLNLPSSTPRALRLLLGFVLAVSAALMAGARPLDPTGSNDIDGYFDVYQSLADGDLEGLTHFGGGFEVGLPLLMYVLTWLPPLTPNGLMFGFALTASLLMLAWLESSFFSTPAAPRPALVGISLLLLNLYFATQLSRQFLSLIVLLFAISATRPTRKMAWLILAASIHLTAIPFFGIYLLARRGPLGWVALVGLALVLRLYFANLVAALGIVPEAIAEKLLYYADNDQEGTDADIGSLRLIVLLGLVSLVSLAASSFRLSRSSRRWLAIPWVATCIHLLLLPIPLASLRITLMIHSVATGLIVYKMLEGRAQRAMPLVLNVLLIYKLVGFATAEKSGSLLSTLSMAAAFLQ